MKAFEYEIKETEGGKKKIKYMFRTTVLMAKSYCRVLESLNSD